MENSFVDVTNKTPLINLYTQTGCRQVPLTPGALKKFEKDRDVGLANMILAQTEFEKAKKRLRAGRDAVLHNGVLVLLAENHIEATKKAKNDNEQARIRDLKSHREALAKLNDEVRELKRSFSNKKR